MTVKPTGYWTFFCNPAKWEIDRFLKSGRLNDNFTITDWQAAWFERGQKGVVRVGVDHRAKEDLDGRPRLQSGIYGIVEVRSKPRRYKGRGDEFWLDAKPIMRPRQMVDIHYQHNLLHAPLLLSDLRGAPNITDKYLLTGFQASTMPLDSRTFKTVMALLGSEELVLKAFDLPAADTATKVAELEAKYYDATPKVRQVVSQQIERGGVANRLKKLAKYQCQVCAALGQNPIGFLKLDGRPYVEAHHVMPVARRQAGGLAPSNLIIVCPNHHRQLHYGQTNLVKSDAHAFVFEIDGRAVAIRKFTAPTAR